MCVYGFRIIYHDTNTNKVLQRASVFCEYTICFIYNQYYNTDNMESLH